MTINKSYWKKFLILTEEDRGFSAGKEISGHVKIEVKDDKGILYGTFKNLKRNLAKYKLLIIYSNKSFVRILEVGDLEFNIPDKAEITWEFDPYDLNETNHSIFEFDAIAVSANYKNQPISEIICPLIGYKDKKINWRKILENQHNSEEANKAEKFNQKEESKMLKEPRIHPGIEKSECDLRDFEQMLVEYLPSFCPFSNSSEQYKWWKIENEGILKNILYCLRIKPSDDIASSFDNYKHLIVGLYNDITFKQNYVVFGVPGIHEVDKNPFRPNISLWVPIQAELPAYGNFGYWILYLNPINGKFLEKNTNKIINDN